MPIKVDIHYEKSVDSAKDLDATYKYLSDMQTTIPKDFPGVERFDRAGEVYRWLFEKVEYGGHGMQLKLATRFQFNACEKIEMSSVSEPGSSTINGYWALKKQNDKTQVAFHCDLQLELPLPFFLKSMATPVAQKEITKLFDRYLANVAKALS